MNKSLTGIAYRLGRASGRLGRGLARHPIPSAMLGVPIVLGASLLPSLFMAIPWPIRKALGMATFAVIVGLGAAQLIRRGRPGQWPTRAEERAASGALGRVLPWLLALATATLAWPLLRAPGVGYGDWDFYLQEYEAVRKSVIEYGQFPWWNPWNRGGFPLAGDPQCSLLPMVTPMVLAFGTANGLRLAVIASMMIAVEGARRLARQWLGDPWAAATAGLVFGLHGGIVVYVVAGLYVPATFCAMPWLLHFTFRLADRAVDGLALGLWAAINVLGPFSYPNIYAITITCAIILWGLGVERGDRRRRFLRHGLLASGIFLALTGWRLAMIASVMGDFPRVMRALIDLRPSAFVEQMLGRPSIEGLRTVSAPIFWESNCGIGVIGVGLAALGLALGWRWWHTLAIVSFVLASGATHWYHLGFWLAYLPVFETIHMVTRWRVAAMLGVGLSAGSAVAWLRRRPRRWLRFAAMGLVLALGLDLIAYGHRALPVARGEVPTEDHVPGPAVDRPISVEYGPAGLATHRGYATIRSIQPLMGYDLRQPTARLWRGHPDYIAEAWTGDRPVTPVLWSPNRIVFQVEPHQIVQINQNPGSWWLVNGRRTFPELRCAEWELPFVARADARGRLDLQIRPIGLGAGIALHAVGLAILGVSAAFRLRRHRPG